jgi:endonuclease-3
MAVHEYFNIGAPPSLCNGSIDMVNPSNPRLRSHAARIHRLLALEFPRVQTPLKYRTAFQLLVATILSAQSTDDQVNRVTAELFRRLPTPEKLASARLDTIEGLIRSTGLYRLKAKNIRNCARSLVDRHAGKVPRSLEALVELPGVGRKTANVVLNAAFGIPGVVVDTHVARVSQRLGLTARQAPEKIEIDLMRLLPEAEWGDFCLRLIFLGRQSCKARRPDCPECPLRTICPWPGKTL